MEPESSSFARDRTGKGGSCVSSAAMILFVILLPVFVICVPSTFCTDPQPAIWNLYGEYTTTPKRFLLTPALSGKSVLYWSVTPIPYNAEAVATISLDRRLKSIPHNPYEVLFAYGVHPNQTKAILDFSTYDYRVTVTAESSAVTLFGFLILSNQPFFTVCLPTTHVDIPESTTPLLHIPMFQHVQFMAFDMDVIPPRNGTIMMYDNMRLHHTWHFYGEYVTLNNAFSFLDFDPHHLSMWVEADDAPMTCAVTLTLSFGRPQCLDTTKSEFLQLPYVHIQPLGGLSLTLSGDHDGDIIEWCFSTGNVGLTFSDGGGGGGKTIHTIPPHPELPVQCGTYDLTTDDPEAIRSDISVNLNNPIHDNILDLKGIVQRRNKSTTTAVVRSISIPRIHLVAGQTDAEILTFANVSVMRWNFSVSEGFGPVSVSAERVVGHGTAPVFFSKAKSITLTEDKLSELKDVVLLRLSNLGTSPVSVSFFLSMQFDPHHHPHPHPPHPKHPNSASIVVGVLVPLVFLGFIVAVGVIVGVVCYRRKRRQNDKMMMRGRGRYVPVAEDEEDGGTMVRHPRDLYLPMGQVRRVSKSDDGEGGGEKQSIQRE